jgi:hypothetical protein
MPAGDETSGLDDQARRLYLARSLTRRATETIGGTVPVETSPDELAGIAQRLVKIRPDELAMKGLHLDPPYPGHVLADDVARRVVLSCIATIEGRSIGRVFTVLIAGREPEVSVEPPTAAG